MPRFVVDVGDLDMSLADQASLATDMQKLALNRVAELKFEKPLALYFPREWWGIILQPDFEGIGPRAEMIGKNVARF